VISQTSFIAASASSARLLPIEHHALPIEHHASPIQHHALSSKYISQTNFIGHTSVIGGIRCGIRREASEVCTGGLTHVHNWY